MKSYHLNWPLLALLALSELYFNLFIIYNFLLQDYFPNFKTSRKPSETLRYIDEGYSRSSALPPPPPPGPEECKLVNDIDKFDCYPEDGASEENCIARGCCWVASQFNHIDKVNGTVPLNTPYCFYPANFSTYKYVNVSETAFGLIIFLNRSYRSPYPNDAEILKMIVKYENENRLHVKVSCLFSFTSINVSIVF